MTQKAQNHRILPFSIQLLSIMGVALGLHWIALFIKGYDYSQALLIQTYTVNFFLAFLIVALIIRFQKAVKNHIGFLFLAGSTLKIAVFFLFFRPLYMVDGQITAIESIGFIVPYLLALFVETRALVRFLSNT